MSEAKFIVFFSTKGGVGKTLISANLAISLAKLSAGKVCLVDLDLQAPMDMARLFNLSVRKSIVDISAFIEKQAAPPNDWKLEEFILRHSSGVDFLAGCTKPNQASYIQENILIEILLRLEKKYDYVIIDAGRAFSDSLISILGFANLILMVVTPDILSIYQTKWALDILQDFRLPLRMVKFVLNRSESLGAFSWREVKTSLPIEIFSQIPSDGKNVVLAVNKHIPVVVDSPRSLFSRAISAFAQELLNKPQETFVKRVELEKLKLLDRDQERVRPQDFWERYGLMDKLAKEEERGDELVELKRRAHKRIIEELDLKRLNLNINDPQKAKEIREKTEKAISNILGEETGALLSNFEVRKHLIKEIADEALGLGPLEDLINAPEITDILVNNKDQIYIERLGKLELATKKFISNEQVRRTIERIIAPLGRRIDESSPMVDARLPDGSRVNAIIPPLSLTGPMLTIRKFRKERFRVEELIGLDTFTSPMAEFLRVCVLCRKNIIVSGGTGSGKTTVLNVLSAFIPEGERIITIEDAAELKLEQEHWARLESRPPNIEGRGEIGIRELFRNTLRMRPDRIIVGECRGAETLDMLQAMNTGHDGSMTTIHANSTHDVLSRLDSMILMSGVELPIRAIREMIASAIDVIVHTARLSDGSRKVTQIAEVTGMSDELHVGIQDILIFRQTGVDVQGKVLGNFEFSGLVPTFIEEIRVRGIKLDANIFTKAFSPKAIS